MKNKLKTFWAITKDSFYNPDFYSSIPQVKIATGLKFVLLLTFFSTIILATKLLIVGIPEFQKFKNGDFVERMYPSELVVTIENGVVSTNVEVPYTIPFQSAQEDEPQNLLVIDTNPEISLNTINSYDSFLVITSDSLVTKESENDTRIIPLNQIDNLVINKDLARDVVGTLMKFLPLIILLVVIVIMPIITLFIFFASIFPLLLLSLIPLIVARVKGWKIGYKDAFKISLYLLGPVIIVDTLAMLLGITAVSFWITLVIMTIVSVLNLRKPSDNL